MSIKTDRPMEQNRGQRKCDKAMDTLFLERKVQQTCSGKKRQPVQQMVLAKLNSYLQENGMRFISFTLYTTHLQVDQRPSFENWNAENARARQGMYFRIVLGKNHLIRTPRTSRWDDMKLKCFCTVKETMNRTNRQPTEWKKIFTCCSLDRANTRIYKELQS